MMSQLLQREDLRKESVMRLPRILFAPLLVLLSLFVAPAHAQFAVIDVGAIAQLIEQVQTLREQLTTARDQLTEARSTLESMRGERGMEQLLAGTVRNYLPPDWAQIEAVLRQTHAGYQGLSGQVRAVLTANAILTAAQMGTLSQAEREQIEAARRAAAMLQVLTREALSSASNRFAAIQQLIEAIHRAQDQKAILDLQARIAAEQGMLQNEQTKLDVLYQTAQAEEWARLQRSREQAIADIGSLRHLPAMGL
jgi:type IV secretion system protein VirB5